MWRSGEYLQAKSGRHMSARPQGTIEFSMKLQPKLADISHSIYLPNMYLTGAGVGFGMVLKGMLQLAASCLPD